ARRIKVRVAALKAKWGDGPYGTGREELHGSHVVEAIEHAPHSIVVEGVRRESLAQEEVGVLVGTKLVQTVQRTAATERIQHESQHDRARVHIHLRGHVVIDKPDEAQLV